MLCNKHTLGRHGDALPRVRWDFYNGLGKDEADGRSGRAGRHGDLAAVRNHDLATQGQADPAAVALGRKEGYEDLLQVLLGDTAAVVRHRYDHPAQFRFGRKANAGGARAFPVICG